MSLPHLHAALTRTDWAALAEQKEVLANEVASIRSARALLAAGGVVTRNHRGERGAEEQHGAEGSREKFAHGGASRA